MNFDGSTKIILERLNGFWVSLLEQMPNMVLALVVLMITWVAAAVIGKIVLRLFKRSKMRESLAVFFRKVSISIVWVFGIVATAVVIFPSVTPAKMLSALGLGSVAIGFAFKDVFENFIAGMLILLRDPFELGDFIECEDAEGFVEEITIRDTRLRQSDGQNIVLPNAMLFKNPVTVRTSRALRRTELICGVDYDQDIAGAREVIKKAVEAVEAVSSDKPVQVFATEFNASSIDFQVTWWTESGPRPVRESRDSVIQSIKAALDDAKIDIPFPHRTLTFKENLQVQTQASQTAQAA